MVAAWQVAAALVSASLAQDFHEVWIPGKRGCWRRYDGYSPEMAGFSSTEASADHCALRCNVTSGCKFFNYEINTSACHLAPSSAVTVNTDNVYLIAGLGKCTTANPCTDTPVDGFPGKTAEQSNMAWMGNRQPVSLECWPKGSSGELMTCPEVGVVALEDTTSTVSPWPGGCTDLVRETNEASSCEDQCRADPTCAVWETGSDGSCYHGVGMNCYNSGTDRVQGQRLQHGNVRVLMDLTGVQILAGMTQAFDVSKVGPSGPFATATEAAEGCKRVCYSDIYCEYWSYSSTYGCWIEDKRAASVAYPLTNDVATRSTAEATNCVGEYIQHYCTTDEETDENWCFLDGTRWVPSTGGQEQMTVESSVDLCQQRCVDSPSCARFSFYAESGQCYLLGDSVVESQDQGATSGLAPCPAAATASCAAHPRCESQTGYCCPNAHGITVDCCETAVVAAEINTRTTTQAAAVSASNTDDDDSGVDWWVIVLMVLAIFACVLIGLFAATHLRKGGGCPDRHARTFYDSEVEADHPSPFDSRMSEASASQYTDVEEVREAEAPLQHEGPVEYDRSRLPFPEAGLANFQDHHVPFPEAGLRTSLLPFPEAGLPNNFQQLHPGVEQGPGQPPAGFQQGGFR